MDKRLPNPMGMWQLRHALGYTAKPLGGTMQALTDWTDVQRIKLITEIYGEDLNGLTYDDKAAAIAILGLAIRFGWLQVNAFYLDRIPVPIDLLAHMQQLSNTSMLTLICILACTPKHP